MQCTCLWCRPGPSVRQVSRGRRTEASRTTSNRSSSSGKGSGGSTIKRGTDTKVSRKEDSKPRSKDKDAKKDEPVGKVRTCGGIPVLCVFTESDTFKGVLQHSTPVIAAPLLSSAALGPEVPEFCGTVAGMLNLLGVYSRMLIKSAGSTQTCSGICT